MNINFNRKVGSAAHHTRISRIALFPIFFSIAVLSACSSSDPLNSAANGGEGGNTNNTVADSSATTGSGTTGGSTDGGGGTGDDSITGGTTGGASGNVAASATAGSSNNIEQIPPSQETEVPAIDSEQTSFFFSYDESASTASRDLALTALENGRKPNPDLGRPYEFLNAEQLSTTSTETVGPFNVSMGLLRSENGDIPLSVETEASVYGLGVNISGPTLTQEDRRNVVLTVLLDISGSMNSSYASETANNISTLLDVAKHGLLNMQQSLKQGDVINLITFATDANILLEAHSPSPNSLDNTINAINTTSSTDIENGLDLAYQVANRTYDPNKANRLVIITDANVNTGVVDPVEIASHTVINGLEGIYFSGVGVGSRFNDRVLNIMTDAGKGSYSAMITPVDAERIFTGGFARFLNPAVRDVRFELTYPQELDQLKSFAEEISAVAEEVQTINFSYNSSQFFLELFSGPGTLSTDGEITLDITYKDDANQAQSATISKGVDNILGQAVVEIKAAAAVSTLAQLINGSLTCDTVLSSQLYNTPVQHDVYVRYKQHIDRFCSL